MYIRLKCTKCRIHGEELVEIFGKEEFDKLTCEIKEVLYHGHRKHLFLIGW